MGWLYTMYTISQQITANALGQFSGRIKGATNVARILIAQTSVRVPHECQRNA